MNKGSSRHSSRKGKVTPLREYEPLLKSIGHETLISMITPEEVEEARALLEKFLKGCQHIDIEKKVVLAYLFGVHQGINEMFEARSGKTLADRLTGVYRMGQQHGMTQAILLFPQGKSN